MTAYRFVTLTCDRCGEIYDSGSCHYVRSARRNAGYEGWTTRTGDDRRIQDWCGQCSGNTTRIGDYDAPVEKP